MEYHIRDERWELFELRSFEAYCDAAVVKGLFHPCVPEDIKEAFTIAEYIMAHSYYHYPLYHEALSKVLRIIEMAVKIRCNQLDIPLEIINSEKRKNLKRLMDELIAAEPAKKLKQQFEVARSLRNSLMHPDRHTYSGAIAKSYIKQTVSLLNTLFLPEGIFPLFENNLQKVQNSLTQYQKSALTLEGSGSIYMLSAVDIEANVRIENNWIYLLVGLPVMSDALDNLKNHRYVKPIGFFISDLIINKEDILCIETKSKRPIRIKWSDNLEHLEIFKDFHDALEVLDDTDRLMYETNTSHEVGEMENVFLYENLYKVDAL
jgi:hypothetical protein